MRMLWLLGFVALALPAASTAQSETGNMKGCTDPRPVLDISFAPRNSWSPLYLVASPDDAGLLPGIRLNVRSSPLPGGASVFTLYFDYDPGLASADYSVYRISYSMMDGSRLTLKEDRDFSEGCSDPSGHGVRSGETFHAAKFSADLSTYSQPRIRITVWGGMF